jgi:tRNA(His) 5'-end guanylyltransferase
MAIKLKDRIDAYRGAAEYYLTPRLPIIICLNGRSFSKLTSLLDKPYSDRFAECILSTAHRLCVEIEGAVFAYQHNDEIVVLARNDQTVDTLPWFDNKLQKICSITASIATEHFNTCSNALDLNVMGDPQFSSEVFVVPNEKEAINTMIYKQQMNFYTSIQFACYYEMIKKHDKSTIKDMLSGLNVDEKVDLLQQECGVDFNEYPVSFRRGSAIYKVPKLMEDGSIKNKWIVNKELPIFTKDQSFLSNLLHAGTDIIRKESF